MTLAILVGLIAFPVQAQISLSGLQQQLQTAVAGADWNEAVQIVDRLIPLVPQQAEQLKVYRVKLQQLSRSSVNAPAKRQSLLLPAGRVGIKRREHGVAVIDVLFNQRRTFEMLVDSGASLTIITRPMASALGLTSAQVVENVTFQTANGQTQLPIVYLGVLTVGGLSTQQVPVAIAGPDMQIGLLGQDFLQRYDVSLRSNQIEFYDRN